MPSLSFRAILSKRIQFLAIFHLIKKIPNMTRNPQSRLQHQPKRKKKKAICPAKLISKLSASLIIIINHKRQLLWQHYFKSTFNEMTA